MKPRSARRLRRFVSFLLCSSGAVVSVIAVAAYFNAGLDAKSMGASLTQEERSMIRLLFGVFLLIVGMIGIVRTRKRCIFEQILMEKPPNHYH